MQLWTDYEGVTIDDAFPLQKLLMPEGRSAFFSTPGPQGEPTVVRLIECHFDEEEILARWRCVEALSHPNFVKFVRFGQTELDGRPVVYAVFEKVDANLAEVLDQGHLTVQDVAQLASSLVAALDALHPRGFIHGHIEPRNIFAVGGAVKLRSDCISEAPEGEEGRAAKQRDVRDLAALLLQGLTQRRSVDGIPNSAMPAPFGQIIRNGLDGTWGLDNIKVALEGQFGSQQHAAPSEHVDSATTAVAGQKAPSAAAKPSQRPEAQLSLPLLDEDRNAGFCPRSRPQHRYLGRRADLLAAPIARRRRHACPSPASFPMGTWARMECASAQSHAGCGGFASRAIGEADLEQPCAPAGRRGCAADEPPRIGWLPRRLARDLLHLQPQGGRGEEGLQPRE